MVMVSVSPRMMVPNHTLTSSPSTTLPMTCALSATHADAATRGLRPSNS